MTITEAGVRAVTVGELLAEALRIPHYQRPYSWTPVVALQLLDDVEAARLENMRMSSDGQRVPYVLGAVIVHDTGDGRDVVDGQQRLLTIRMLMALLDPENHGLDAPFTQDTPVGRVWAQLRGRLAGIADNDRIALRDFLLDRCTLVRVETDDVDEAFRVFDAQNYRGKPLAPHDLLKAHHLREMTHETAAMKAAVVEGWEGVRDKDLDRLFSVYLYRIARWSRGEGAPRFTSAEVNLFKGISPGATSPTARYHLAAQAAVPVLAAWAGAIDARDGGRARFQLDAPVPAGRAFFELVTFMLGELRELARESFDGDRARYSVYDPAALGEEGVLEERLSMSRYRYVSELYLAALLYYTNRFGTEQLATDGARIFAWAYAPRVEMWRVQYRTIDNRGRGEDRGPSAFPLMRNAMSGRVVNLLDVTAIPPEAGHEPALAALLNGTTGA